MSNTIKLKRGSGSDPSASDLVVGELAIRTDSGKIFTKKDNGSVAEISGGGGIDDGDKGDITISNGGDTFTIDNGVVTEAKIADDSVTQDKLADNSVGGNQLKSNSVSTAKIANGNVTTAKIAGGAVTSAKIADGTIVNADISGSAAIDGSKLQAAGLVNAGSMSAANFNKLAGIEANATADMTGTEILATISGEDIILGEIASTGNSTFAGNVTLSSSDSGSSAAPELDLYRISASPADADYLGQIKFSGEDAADNKQVYAKITGKIGDATNTTEDGILEFMLTKAGSNNIAARFTSTDLKLINGTGLEVAGNISCDGTVDGVDIAARDTLFGGLTSSSGVLTNGVTATTQSAGNNTTRVATTAFVSTAISNLINNAPSALDTLKELSDALGADANFSTTVTNNLATKMPLAGGEFTGNVISHNITPDTDSTRFLGSNGIRFSKVFADVYEGSGANLTNLPSQTDNNFTDADHSKLDGIESNATADQTASEILTLIKTVDGSGSGLDADTLDGISSASFVRSDASDTLTGGTYTFNSSTTEKIKLTGATNPYIRFQEGTTNKAFIQWHSTQNCFRLQNQEDSATLRIKDDLDFSTDNSTFYSIFHEGNLTVGDGGLTQNNFTDADHSKLNGIEANATADQSNSEIKTAYEANSNTNAFTDALLSKLNGIAAGATNVTNNNQLTNGAGYVTANTQLTNEQVQDIVGGMVTGNTESGITVTYQDSDGTLDFSIGTLGTSNIANNAIDFSKMQDIGAGRIIGNASGSTGNPDQLTAAQVRTIINVEDGATADQTASEILTLIKTVDGNGSGLDADTLDGLQLSSTATANTVVQRNSSGYVFANFFNTTANDVSSGVTKVMVETGNDNYIRHGSAHAVRTFINVEDGATADQSASEILTLLKTVDGAGSGLDADTLDGISSASFLRSDAVDSSSEDITINGLRVGEWTSASYKGIFHSSQSGSEYMMISNDGHTYISATTGHNVYLRASANNSTNQLVVSTGGTTIGGNTVLTTASGINASNINSGTINSARVPTLNQNTTGSSGSCTGNAATATRLQTARTIAGVSFNGTANISLNNNAITNGAGYVTSSVINSLNASNLSSGTIPDARFPSTLPAIDGSNLTGISAGATGGGSDEIFYENGQTVTTNYTITNGKNAMSAGPITINSGVTVTVGSGENLIIV